MTDRQLTTRDLTGEPHGGTSDPQGDREATATDSAGSGRDMDPEVRRESRGETTAPAADEPLGRDRADVDVDEREGGRSGRNEPLLPADQSDRFTKRWQELQAGFVDQPRESVEQADALVADLMQRLAAGFANERQGLEAQWDRGDDVSTEDLRVALTRYRSFFDRLLSA
jgi:hypothetical protein